MKFIGWTRKVLQHYKLLSCQLLRLLQCLAVSTVTALCTAAFRGGYANEFPAFTSITASISLIGIRLNQLVW